MSVNGVSAAIEMSMSDVVAGIQRKIGAWSVTRLRKVQENPSSAVIYTHELLLFFNLL